MIEYQSFIYLDVYRTGSSHIQALLPLLTSEPCRATLRHASLTRAHPLGFVPGKRVFASVRNPWDWYVSLWAYGAGGGSAIRRYLLAHRPAEEVAALYDRREPALSFRRWLVMLHDPAVLDAIMEEHLPQSGLASAVGLCTYRFLRVTTRWPRLLLRRALIDNPARACRHHARFCAYHDLLRSESLDADLARFISGRPRSFRADALQVLAARSAARHNASPRPLAGYRDYYNDETRALVAARDHFFVETFGYAF
jgi:hypothetical protein